MAIIKKFKLKLGNMDYNENGRYSHPVEISVELREHKDLKNGELSIQGEVWLPSRRDCAMGGQCYDSIDVRLLQPKFRRKFLKVCKIWSRWHLNDCRAGSPAQMEALREAFPKNSGDYEKHIEHLKALGIYNDPALDGYEYGSKWLREELPDDVLATILSWEPVEA